MPGPLITGNVGDHFQVIFPVYFIAASKVYHVNRFIANPRLQQLNVVNQLTDPSLDRATSVVSVRSLQSD